MEGVRHSEGNLADSEASIGDLRELGRLRFDRKKCRDVFVRGIVCPQSAAIVTEVRAAGQAGIGVASIPGCWVAVNGSIGGTYIGMIYENVVTITQALGGTPAALPEALADWAREWDIAQ